MENGKCPVEIEKVMLPRRKWEASDALKKHKLIVKIV